MIALGVSRFQLLVPHFYVLRTQCDNLSFHDEELCLRWETESRADRITYQIALSDS